MIHLDTHIVIWLAERSTRLSQVAKRLAQRGPLAISPAIEFELEFLSESGRLKSSPDRILNVMMRDYAFSWSGADFDDVARSARTLAWTRDPFDRLIVATAMVDDVKLLTADVAILEHFAEAVW